MKRLLIAGVLVLSLAACGAPGCDDEDEGGCDDYAAVG